MVGKVGRKRVLGQLLDAQGDALAVGVDGQHHGFQLFALVEVAHDLFAVLVPGQVGQVHQAVDAAVQTDEHAEVGDRLDGAAHLVALLEVLGELVPRVGDALLDAQADAATLFVDVQHHDLDFVADVDDLAGVDVLVGPVHFGHVDQTFHTLLDLDEGAVIGDVGDLAEQARAFRVAAGNVDPGVFAQLLQAQRHPHALAVELEHLDFNFLAGFNNFRRVLHALPRHVGDVQQAVDATQVHKGAVVDQVLDHALQHHAFLQVLQQLFALGAVLFLEHFAAADHNIVAQLVQLDDLELQRLAFQIGGVAHGANVDQRAGQEGPHVADVDGVTTLDLAADLAVDDLLVLEGGAQEIPGLDALGLFLAELGFAKAVFHGFQRDFDVVAFRDGEFARLVVELLDRDHALGLEAGVNNDDIGLDEQHGGGHDGPRLHGLLGNRLLKELGETFSHVDGWIVLLPRPRARTRWVEKTNPGGLLQPTRAKINLQSSV